jgi:hypothetical protein
LIFVVYLQLRNLIFSGSSPPLTASYDLGIAPPETFHYYIEKMQ